MAFRQGSGGRWLPPKLSLLCKGHTLEVLLCVADSKDEEDEVKGKRTRQWEGPPLPVETPSWAPSYVTAWTLDMYCTITHCLECQLRLDELYIAAHLLSCKC